METKQLRPLTKKYLLIKTTVITVVLIISQLVLAQENTTAKQLKQHSIGLGIGQTFLLGDYDNTAEDGVTVFDLYHVYTASYSFDLFSNLHINTLSKGDEETSLFGLSTSVRSRIFQFDSISPFVFGGLGFYKPRVKFENAGNLEQSKSKIVFGINGGAGVDLELDPKYSISLLAHYHLPFDVKQENGSSLDGSYLKLLIALFYKF